MIATEDPTAWIEDIGPNWVIYQGIGERWIIRGRCIACGECETPGDLQHTWTGLPVGQAGACLDPRFGERRDVPVRPEISRHPHCTLSGEYLSGDQALSS